MHYLINPIWFYLMELCGTIKDFAGGAIFVFSIILVITLFIYWCLYDECNTGQTFIYKKMLKIFIIIDCIATILAIFVPSQETCVKMMIASQVTDENIEKVEKTIQDSVDYIFDKLGNNNNSDKD